MTETAIAVRSPEELAGMPDEYREVLTHQLLAHTEGELSGADTYWLWAPHAPNAYERKVVFEAAADEMKHFMIGADLLKDIGVSTDHMLTQTLQDRTHYPSDFARDTTNWAERGLTSMLAERAALEHIIEMGDSSYRPLADSCKVVIKEEAEHIGHGIRIVRDLCKTSDGYDAVQENLQTKWPQVLDLFGSSESKRSKVFLRWGLRRQTNDGARSRFVERTIPKLAALGLTIPDSRVGRKYL
jgi:ring-1,2-phenylacetyl-CoA epoxidase subunit PaaA